MSQNIKLLMLLLAISLKLNILQQTINPSVHPNPHNIDPQDQNP